MHTSPQGDIRNSCYWFDLLLIYKLQWPHQQDLVDFNDDDKLGSGKEKVDTLSKLIAIFENPWDWM